MSYQRRAEFKAVTGFDFSDLAVVVWKDGCQPQNTADYYYLGRTGTFYSYYSVYQLGIWKKEPEINPNDIISFFDYSDVEND